MLQGLFNQKLSQKGNVFVLSEQSDVENQQQTNQAFSNKWTSYSKEEINEQEKLFEFQKKWYLELYGFDSEEDFAKFLRSKKVILDAGSGLGYKSKWFSSLAPDSIVIGMDYSFAASIAADRYSGIDNLYFVRGDISDTSLKNGVIDYVSCDQVIHHTQDPLKTYAELVRVLKKSGEFSVYVYAKKALPRELVDDYFREASKEIDHDAMTQFSEQLTELGKRLSELNVTVDIPDIPLLGIKGGEMDIQRFIYWNFLKCFWNPDLGWATSVSTNYDWYAPSNAYRYTREEFLNMAYTHGLEEKYVHSEEACHSGRFKK